VAKENFPESILVFSATEMFNLNLGNFWVIKFYYAAVNNFENYLNQIRVVECDKVWFSMLVYK